MREAGIDALVATKPINVAYMSDYFSESSRADLGVQVYGIVPLDGPLGLIVPSLEVDAWAEQPGEVGDVTVYGILHRWRSERRPLEPDDQRIHDLTMGRPTHQDAIEALVQALRRRGLEGSSIGVDETGVTPLVWDRMREALPRAQIVPAGPLFQYVRMVKTEEEIRRLAASARITEQAMAYAWSDLPDGVTERALADRFRTKVIELGGDPAFWIVSVGRRTAHTHNRITDARAGRGELAKFDMGCRYELYWSDVGRTKSVGEASDRDRRLYEILCAGVKAATARVRPGVRPSELFETAVGTIRDAGIPDYRRHHTGHGIGISVYDPPIVEERGYRNMFGIGAADPPLEIGMVTNIETPYYLLGDRGFIVEDTMVVREDGPELLTHLDYSLAP